MNINAYLQKQFNNLNAVFHSIVDDLTDEEWVTRPAPGQNTLGYTAWHMPRTQDNFVQAWIRGTAEVAHADRWMQWQPLRRLGIGVGITLDEADEIARSVRRADVSDYADAVHQSVLAWLGEVRESDLEQVPAARGYLSAFPEYQTHGYMEEVNNLYDLPVWGLLIRPCMGHIHRHLGELDVMKTVLRTQG
jgi:DinB superfamily